MICSLHIKSLAVEISQRVRAGRGDEQNLQQPKCPKCIAAYLTLWRGAGVAMSVAMHLRPMSKDTATPRTLQTGRSTSNSPQMTQLRCSNVSM